MSKINLKYFFKFEWAIILALLIVSGIFYFKATHAPKTEAKAVEHLAEIKNAPVQHAKDDSGRDHGIKEVGIGTRSEIDAVWGAEKKDLLKQLNAKDKLLSVKEKELQAFYSIGSHTEGDVIPDVERVIEHDSVNYKFSWKNRWMQIDGTVGPTMKQLHYSRDDSMTAAFYWKRKIPLIGRKYTYMNAFSQDSNTHITGLTAVQIKDLGYDKFRLDMFGFYQTNFGVKQYAGAGLSGEYFFTKRLSLEVGYQYQYDGTGSDKALQGKVKYTITKF